MASSVGKKILIWCWALFGAAVLFILGLLGSVWFFADIPSFEELERPNNKLATQVLSDDGQILTTDTPRRFFGNNSFYTTAANRMSRHVFSMAVTAEAVIDLCKQKDRE